ncbi:two-component system regulatory protein YycI [Alkaliphilus serpentinus]|uniref:Regulatory protein YycH-like domain-containing protein n=1 Tax=Alkaliphilus serpentinus TaxID=1482731 RepID=A0A833HQR3_9FIRM|nr:two-component system regulatory protein YycI [Alkaliphilus serpentinus]KAB3532178.1 hypothetical protein F8153_02670 [Alkaliphilus serpentinus]
MDWSKAKNIIIAAFVITNLFLIFFISRGMLTKGDLQLITPEYITYVANYLNENGITVKTEVPTEILSLPVIEVKYESFDPDEMAASLLGVPNSLVGTDHYKSGDKELIIEDGKRLKFNDYSDRKEIYSFDESNIEEYVTNFLTEHELIRDNLQLSQIHLENDYSKDSIPTYKLVYNQTYKGRFLGESYIYVYVNNKGVVALEAMLLNYQRTYSHKKLTITATDALLRKMSDISRENSSRVAIINIELGYYFDPYDVQETDLKSIEFADAFPAWKITLDNGKEYYVEAIKN